jgi:hypothetical protein
VEAASQVRVSRARRVEVRGMRVKRGGSMRIKNVEEVKGEVIEVEGGEVKVEGGLKVTIGRMRLNHGSLVIQNSKDVVIMEVLNGGLILVKDS